MEEISAEQLKKVLFDLRADVTALQFFAKELFTCVPREAREEILSDWSRRGTLLDSNSSDQLLEQNVPVDDATRIRTAQRRAFVDLERILRTP